MSKTGASQLLYQQYFWLTKLLFMMQPTGSQTLIAQLPSVLTGKLSHILPFALLTARCDGREAAGTGGHRCYRSPCRSRDRAVPCRAEGSAQLRGAPGSAAHRTAPSGPPSRRGPLLPNNDPRLPDPSQGSFPPSPDTRSGVYARVPTTGTALPESAGDDAGASRAEERDGHTEAPVSPCGRVLPSQRRRPRQPGPLTGFPGRQTPLTPKHDVRLSPPLPSRAGSPSPAPRCPAPPARGGGRDGGRTGARGAALLRLCPAFRERPARQRRGREQGWGAEAALAVPRPWSPTSCAFPRP